MMREMCMSKKTHNDGQRDGSKWAKNAKEHPIRHRIDPCGPSKPHETGNDNYNKGVDIGVKDAGGKKWW
jgi:hypothetical protein